jgi:hypothetical protein
MEVNQLLDSGATIDILPAASNLLVQLGAGTTSAAGSPIVTAEEVDRDGGNF